METYEIYNILKNYGNYKKKVGKTHFNFRWNWLVEDPHGGLLFCFGLICIDLTNVFWSTAVVFFQHFYAPISTSLFLSDCQIVWDPTRTNRFYGQVFMQYWMYVGRRNSHGCLYVTWWYCIIISGTMTVFKRPSRTSYFSDRRPQLNSLNQFFTVL